MKQEPRYAYGHAVKTKVCSRTIYDFRNFTTHGQQETLGEHFFDNGFEKHLKEKDSESIYL